MLEVSKVLYTVYTHSMLLMSKCQKCEILYCTKNKGSKDQKIKSYVEGVKSGVCGCLGYNISHFQHLQHV